MGNREVYQRITDRMIAALEQGTVPWRKPWTAAGGGRPKSMSTREPYRGINVLLLATDAMDKGYRSPWWGTYNQIAQLSGMQRQAGRGGGQYWASPDGGPRGVRKGEHGSQIVLWKKVPQTEADPDTGEKTTRDILLARLFTVFNAEQAEALPEEFLAGTGQPVEQIQQPQQVLDHYLRHGGPRFRHVAGDRACYNPADDTITLPERGQFRTSAGYYATAFHEAGHSTGHARRLARESLTNFSHDRRWGDELYAKEELAAEMTSAMLQAETGIDGQFSQSAAYIADWLTALKKDPALVPHAAAQAQRACDLITEPERQGTAQPQEEAEAAA
jgi:antirestriction protein ArdC